MTPKFLTVGDNQIAYYESAGTGSPIFLIHGNSASTHAFQHQMESDLANQARIISIDLPGHGNSPAAADPQATYNMAGYAGIIAAAATQLNATNAVFVGWSLGGHILLEAVAQLPEAAGFLIHGTPPLAIPPAMEAAFFPNPAMGAAFTPDLDNDAAVAFANAFFKSGVQAPSTFVDGIQATDGQARAFLGASIGAGAYTDEVIIVAEMSQPLAILHGEQEQLVNGDYFASLTAPTLWRGATQVIADAGHTPQWEQPEAYNALVAAFVQDVA